VFSCHVTASYCELQPCGKNVQYTWVFGLLQPLPGDFRWNYVTPGSLLVTWSHVTSFPVEWLPPPSNYRFVGSETHIIREFSAFYSRFQVNFRWNVTSASLLVTGGHVTSNSCHMTDSSCNVQPCRKQNAHHTWVFGILQPYPVDFQWKVVTSGSLPVNWGDMTAFPVSWLPPPESYSLVGSGTHIIRVFGVLQALPGDFRSNDVTYGSLPFTWCQVMAFPVTWVPPPASYSLVESETLSRSLEGRLYRHSESVGAKVV